MSADPPQPAQPSTEAHLPASLPPRSPLHALASPSALKPFSLPLAASNKLNSPDKSATVPAKDDDTEMNAPLADVAIDAPLATNAPADATMEGDGSSTSNGKRRAEADQAGDAAAPAVGAASDGDEVVLSAGNGAHGEAKQEGPPKKKRKSEGKPATAFCHQDHQPHEIAKVVVLRCTGQKPVGKNKTMKPCTLAYCEKCLKNRYGEDATAMKASGADATWICPSCRTICNCSTCRKKSGLEATGTVKKLAQDNGVSNVADLLSIVPSARSAARAANDKLSATFTAGGKMAAQSLTRDDSDGESGGKASRKKKGKKDGKSKPTDGAASDSSLSSLSDSDDSSSKVKAKPKVKKAAKPRASSASATPAPAGTSASSPSATGGPAGPKRAVPPRAPAALAAPPPTHALSSVYYTSPHLPCTDSLLARLNLREFFLRFLHLMPSLLPNASSTSTSKSHSKDKDRLRELARANKDKKVKLSPALARVLSALADDVLWLWSDGSPAAETVQLSLLDGLIDVLLDEKANSGALDRPMRDALKRARADIARSKESGAGRTRDRPWKGVVFVLKRSATGKQWIGQGDKWAAEWRARAGVAEPVKQEKVEEKANGEEKAKEEVSEKAVEEDAMAVDSPAAASTPAPDATAPTKQDKGKGKARASTPGGDDDAASDLSSLPSRSRSTSPARSRSSSPVSSAASSASAYSASDDEQDELDDDEVDQLASDYDSAAEEEKKALKRRERQFDKEWAGRGKMVGVFDDEAEGSDDEMEDDAEEGGEEAAKKRRAKGERETCAEERLALCCGLVDLAVWTDLVRDDMKAGTDKATEEQVKLRKDFFDLRRGLPEEKQRLQATKPEKPPGNEVSEKVKEWRRECEKVDEEIKDAEIRNTKDNWRNQHDTYLSVIKSRLRFGELGADCLGNQYYFLSPPPRSLLHNSAAAATSGFPLQPNPSNDYPLSYSIVVHGKRPVPPTPSDQPTRSTKSHHKRPLDPALDALDATQSRADEWFVVREIGALDSLAAWIDSTTKHAEYALKLAEHHAAHPPSAKAHKTKAELAAVKPVNAEEMARLRKRVEGQNGDVADGVRQFAQYLRWVRELAVDAKDAEGERRFLRDR
ncbi:hypothetical protein JCM10207_005894 [Rhodosporidiobolus poonsookiae]